MGEEGRRRRLSRRVKVALVCLCVLAVLALAGVALWHTGRPQAWLVEYGISRGLGAQGEVEGVSVGPPGRIARLELLDAPSGVAETPFLHLEELQLDYDLDAANKRYIKGLALDTLVVKADGRDLLNPNYDFLVRLLNAPSSGIDPTPYLPKKVSIDALDVSAEMPTWSLRVEGARANGAINTLDALEFTVSGSPLRATWSVAGLDTGLGFLEGDANFLLTRGGGVMKADANVELPGLATVDASGELMQGPGVLGVNLDVRDVTLQDELWGAVARDVLPWPLTFDSLRISDSRLKFSWFYAFFTVSDAQFHAAMDGVVFGPSESPYYTGPLLVTAEGGFGGDVPLTMSATLNAGQTIKAVLDSPNGQRKGHVTISDWTRKQVNAVVPAAYRSVLESMPKLSALSVDMEGEWAGADYTLKGRVTPTLGDAGPVLLDVKAWGGPSQSRLCDVAVDTTWREGKASLQVTVNTPSDYLVWLNVENVSPRDWAQVWMGTDALAQLATNLRGAVHVQKVPDSPLRADVSLQADTLSYGSFGTTFELGAELNTEATLDAAASRAMGKALRLSLGGAYWNVKDWHAALDPLDVGGAVECKADFAVVAAWLGIAGVQGEGTATTNLRVDSSALTLAALEVKTETAGYGDWTTPYGMPVEAKGDLRVAFDGMAVTSEQAEIALGDDTRVTAKEISFTPAAGENAAQTGVAEMVVDTAFAPLVAKGYLDEATGTAKVKGSDISFDAEGFKGGFDYAVAAENIILADALAALYGMKADGHLGYVGELTGAGTLAADKAIAGGAALNVVRCEIVGEGKTLRLSNIEATLFDGGVKGDFVVHLFETGMPMEISATLDNADLAVFTEEYKPPAVKLTGRVKGEASVRLGANGIEDLSVDLETIDGMTMNRDAVAQILLSQYMGEVTAGKTLSKAVEQTIGEEPDRPFDSGRIQLSYKDGKIVGMAKLESRLLNLTVDIKADPETLSDAMMLRQTERIQFETVEPTPKKEVE